MKTVAVIQARMQSVRLPGKVLAEVQGAPLLAHVVNRARLAVKLDAVVVATSVHQADDSIARFCLEAGIDLLRGSCDDVLDRYHDAARMFGADVIVRLTADCPLADPEVIDRVVSAFQQGSFDYVSNTLACTYPDGLDVEVFSRESLVRSWRQARLNSDREHVTSYMVNHPKLFRLACVRNDVDLSAMRWTVDHPEDLEFMRQVYSQCGPAHFGMAEVLALLDRQAALREINSGFERNEGYRRSLNEDCSAETTVAQ